MGDLPAVYNVQNGSSLILRPSFDKIDYENMT